MTLAGCAPQSIPLAPDELQRSGAEPPAVAGPGTAANPANASPARVAERSIDAATAYDSFEMCWSLVNEHHFDPTHNGVDWEAVRVEFAPRAETVQSRAELRHLLNEMLSRLGQSHFGVMPSGAWDDEDAEGEGHSHGDSHSGDGSGFDDGLTGLTVRSVEGSMVVTAVDPGSPAETAGIQAGWVIESIDGERLKSAIPEDVPEHLQQLASERIVESRLAGAAKSSKVLTLRTADGTEQEAALTLTRDRSHRVTFGVLPPITVELDHRAFVSEDWQRVNAVAPAGASLPRVGYIQFTAWFPVIASEFDAAIDQLRDSDAIVLDLRGNPGGVGFMATGIAGHFVEEPTNLGDMMARTGTIHFLAQPRTVAAGGREVKPFSGPLAILVDSQTGSTSEVFAGGMVDVGRAEVFGGPSAGAALPASLATLPSGDVFLYAIADFRVPSGSSIEGVGVVPTIEPAPSLVDYSASPDPTLRQALNWIARGAPDRASTSTPASPSH